MKKKLFMFIFMGILAVINMGKVNAGSYTVSFDYQNIKYIDGVYQNHTLVFINLNDNPAYCIDQGTDLQQGQSTSNTDNSAVSSYNSCIALASYYGPSSFSTSANRAKYIASQIYIWKECQGDSRSFSFTEEGSWVDYSDEYDELEDKIDSYYDKPSFCGTTVNATNNTMTLTDSNSVLSNYNVSANNNVTATKNENSLEISGLTKGTTTISLSKGGTGSFVVADFGSSLQRIYQGYELPSVSCDLTVNYDPMGTIKVIKIEKDNSIVKLAGVEFELYNEDDELLATKVTDENGEVLFEGLSYGTYYIKETKTNESYVIDENVHTIVLDQDMIEEVFENELVNVKTGRRLLYVIYSIGFVAISYAIYYIVKSKKLVK